MRNQYVEDDIINKLLINIVYPDSSHFSDVSKQAPEKSNYYYERFIADTINEVFARYDSERIIIDKLSIDLGTVSPEDIPCKLTDALDRELRKNRLYGIVATFITQGGENIATEQDANRIDNYIDTIDAFDMEFTKESEIVDLFLDYLINPVKPWYLSSGQKYDIDGLTEKAMTVCLSGNESNSVYFYKLINLISGNRTAFKRFTLLVNNDSIDKILLKYITVSKDRLSNTVSSKMDGEVEQKMQLFPLTLYKSIEQEIGAFPESRKKEIRIEVLQYLLYGESEGYFLRSRIRSLRVEQNISKPLSRSRSTRREKFGLLRADALAMTELKHIQPVINRILIANAGLVLLAPLLETLFSRLNYLDNKKRFRTEKHRQRAVHLLQVMTGEKGKHQEYLLPLNKIMCGISPDFPVNPVFRATKEEKEETDSLLKSVIEHWKTLHGTSIAGLQETFIRRNGTVECSGTDWIVRVENKGVDILLDDLPWSTSTLTFPWNEYIIYVEWKR